MFITFWQEGCSCHIVTTRLFSSHCNDGIFASHCDEEAMFIILRRWGYVHNIAMTRLFWSHCDDKAMFVTLWRQGNFHHIATRRLCLSYCDDKAIFFTLKWHDICVTLRLRGHANHIMTRICSLHCDDKAMFITLRQWGYVCHFATTGLCSSHYNVSMFSILWCYYVCHIATLLCSSCCNVQFCSLDCNVGLCSSHDKLTH